jgi:hypothetical protein
MVTVALPLPPAFVAVTSYEVEGDITIGVPDIVPFEVSKDNPVGRAGEIDHETTVPPLAVGVTVCIGELLVRVNELGLYTIEEGAASLTIIVTVAVALPPVFSAVTVYVFSGEIAVGVPEIVPVEASKESPDGRVGEIVHVSTSPPLFVGVTAFI